VWDRQQGQAAKIDSLAPSPLDAAGRVSKVLLTILTTTHLDPDSALLLLWLGSP
jgi:hypothetical protein